MMVLSSSMALADTAFVHNEQIHVEAGATTGLVVPVTFNEVSKIKVCLAFNSPNKNVELIARLKSDSTTQLWVGSTKSDCTVLEDINVEVGSTAFVKLSCRNFDLTPANCNAVIVAYGKELTK